jgi:hypothetical protein
LVDYVDFVAAQLGRWRMWPVSASGNRGTPRARYTITDEMPPELHNRIGRKVTHAGIYTEARIRKGELGNIIVDKARAVAPKTLFLQRSAARS